MTGFAAPTAPRPVPPPPVLSARQLSKHYGPNSALYPLDLELHPGEFLGLLGVNGSSTLR